MRNSSLTIVILGLSITSSWGNGHAATYRGLVRGLRKRGHSVLFLERDAPWYASSRDMTDCPYCRTELYSSIQELEARFAGEVREADFVMVGSYVPEGVRVGAWVTRTCGGKTGFYDIDTPVTLERLAAGKCDYLEWSLIPRYDMYLSFTGGPILDRLEVQFRAKMARALYCSVDPELYFPVAAEKKWDLGYMGTYSLDRQSGLDLLLMEPARRWRDGRFIVAGPLYPEAISWPENIERTDHIPPGDHCAFYNSQRFTLNVTRAEMKRAGFSPSVRLFEAALCGVPVISDDWEGLDRLFAPGSEILISHSPEETMGYLREMKEQEAQEIAQRARARVLEKHTSLHRAQELETFIRELVGWKKSE